MYVRFRISFSLQKSSAATLSFRSWRHAAVRSETKQVQNRHKRRFCSRTSSFPYFGTGTSSFSLAVQVAQSTKRPMASSPTTAVLCYSIFFYFLFFFLCGSVLPPRQQLPSRCVLTQPELQPRHCHRPAEAVSHVQSHKRCNRRIEAERLPRGPAENRSLRLGHRSLRLSN